MTTDLQSRADFLGPWRYDHSHAGVLIKGDPQAAPIHGSYGRGRDLMAHVLDGLGTQYDLSKLRAIDLGCLEGHYTELLCRAGFAEVVAVDLSPEHVQRARFLVQELKGYRNARFEVGSVEDRAFLSGLGRFNIILFHGLLYHLQEPIGMFALLQEISAKPHVLLLSTQFKFNFAEIAVPSPIGNIKFRKQAAGANGLVQYEGERSMYAPLALRLNPWALYRLLRHFGYTDITAYDTPLGCRYGFHVHLIASREDQSDLRKELNKASDIPRLRFYSWNGDRLDGFDLKRDKRAWVSRFLMRASYSLSERLGGSAMRQMRRKEIVKHQDKAE